MRLVIGGIASGKRSYVRRLGFDESQMGRDLHDGKPVLLGLEELLRDGPLTDDDFDSLCKREVIVCCEVGQGVVPVDAHDRAWRELVGRTCAQLAQEAEEVVRMVCGIPVTLTSAQHAIESGRNA